MIFRSIDEWKKYFFPKQYEKERLAKMSPEELGREYAQQMLEVIRETYNTDRIIKIKRV